MLSLSSREAVKALEENLVGIFINLGVEETYNQEITRELFKTSVHGEVLLISEQSVGSPATEGTDREGDIVL